MAELPVLAVAPRVDLAAVGDGGLFSVVTGFSASGSSGQLSLETATSGSNGVSADLTASTGNSLGGTSGDVKLQTGSAVDGTGGDPGVELDHLDAEVAVDAQDENSHYVLQRCQTCAQKTDGMVSDRLCEGQPRPLSSPSTQTLDRVSEAGYPYGGVGQLTSEGRGSDGKRR